MPQDIPYESSEELDFTPECLVELGDEAPSFVLRAATRREKRHHRRLHVEEGIRVHNNDAIRAEILRGLQKLWEPEAFEKHAPIIKEYWSAQDEFVLQKKADDTLEWSYDQEVVDVVDDLVSRVVDAWEPLRRMMADNADYAEMAMPLMVAVVVKSWKGLKAVRRMDRGYVTLDVIENVEEELSRFDEKVGVPKGTAWADLFVACTRRMHLGEDEAKNSASPSLSETTQPASNETNISEQDGPSPESTALSTETPASM